MASKLSTSTSPWTRFFLLRQTPKPLSTLKTQPFLALPSRPFCSPSDPVRDLLAELEREKQKERDERRRAGLPPVADNEEEEEDYMGVQPLIDKLEKRKLKDDGPLELREEPTDSETDEDDERFSAEAVQEREALFQKKCDKHQELLKNFTAAETFDEAFKWMNNIDKFEQKHLRLPLEYRVIGEMLNRLKEATGKEKFMLQQKLNRAMRLVRWKELYDPNNPANFGVVDPEQIGESTGKDTLVDEPEEKELMEGEEADRELDIDDDEEEEFNDDKDEILMEKLNAIDKKLEDKLAILDHTFGKKRRVLEEEIKDLAEERNELTETKTRPLYRKGFDVKLVDVNRTCKVTKGGQVISFSAIVACGNYHGVIGFAKAKAPSVPIALQKAYEKCFQNLHYIERHEEHTIAHAVQTHYKKTKIYLWPASTQTGMKAGKTVMIILNLAGFKNIKSKVIGSRNPYNTVKAVFKALNAVETPTDVQQKLGRTVVESYLL